MGGNLFIRVCAVTYDEERLYKDWPMLMELVWPPSGGVDPTGDAVRKTFGKRAKGVLELAAGVVDMLRFGTLSGPQKERMAPHGEQLKKHLATLEEALGNRDVHKAGDLTNKIEDTLDALEAACGSK